MRKFDNLLLRPFAPEIAKPARPAMFARLLIACQPSVIFADIELSTHTAYGWSTNLIKGLLIDQRFRDSGE
jgi:hypothetical protein